MKILTVDLKGHKFNKNWIRYQKVPIRKVFLFITGDDTFECTWAYFVLNRPIFKDPCSWMVFINLTKFAVFWPECSGMTWCPSIPGSSQEGFYCSYFHLCRTMRWNSRQISELLIRDNIARLENYCNDRRKCR